MKKFLSLMLVLGVVLSIIGTGPLSVFADTAEDQRAYIHGVNFVKLGGQDVLVFSSDQYPPSEPVDTNGEWVHNVYYSMVNPATADGILPVSDAHVLVDNPLAQEPASAAVNSQGKLVVTCEDAELNPESLDQTYGMWSSDLTQPPVVPYGVQLMTGGGSDPENPNQGGHSGHVAASGTKFLTTFCDGWIDGGGVNNLGTGDDIYSRIINEDGSMGTLEPVCADPDVAETDPNKSRDWWPVVAGSNTNWLQVWQKYGTAGVGGGTIYGAITSQDGKVGPKFVITNNNKYYYYDVCYIPSIGEYLVTGSRMDGGFMSLVDKTGNVVMTKTGLPNTVREAKTVVGEIGGKLTAVYPTEPTGIAVVELTANSINIKKTVSGNHIWSYMGTDGLFVSDSEVLFTTGTKEGIKFVRVNIDTQCSPALAKFKAKLSDPSQSPVVVCLGDSITEKNGTTEGNNNYVDYLDSMLKSINPNTTVINAGISGDTTGDALERLKTDVLDKKPDLTFIRLGINDGSPTWNPNAAASFHTNYLNIIKQLQDSGSEIVLMTQNAVQDNAYNGSVLFTDYPGIEADIVSIANQKGLPVIDDYTVWTSLKEDKPNLFNSLMHDSAHPNGNGHIFYFMNLREKLINYLDLPYDTWGADIKIALDELPDPTDDYSFLENVALNKPATATSEYTDDSTPAGTFGAAKAVDGDFSTRWDSLEGPDIEKPQMFTVDLLDVYSIKKVVISWDSSAKEYDIQLSNDGQNWTTAYSTTDGGNAVDEVVPVTGQARYVRFVGKLRWVEDWGFSFTEFRVFGFKPFETTTARWKDNKDAAVTYGFAGAFKASLGMVEPLMQQYGIKGTGYIYPGDVGSWDALPTWDEYKDIADRGNISFGFFGPSWRGHYVNRDGSWGGDAMTKEATVADIVYGKNLIEDQLGYSVDVMMGNDYFTGKNDDLTTIMSENFLATMHGDFESDINQWNTTDYYRLGGAVIYPGTDWSRAVSAEGLRELVDDAIAQKGFLAIEGRGVYNEADYPDGPDENFPDWWGPTPLSFYEDNFAYLDAHRDSIWNDTLANIVKYMRERDALTSDVLEMSDDSAVIEFGLPSDMTDKEDSFGNPTYDQAVTVKTSVPNDWLSATVSQGAGDESGPITPIIENGKKWIVYNIVPGAGDVHINVGEKGDYASTGKIRASVVDGSVNVAGSMDKIEDGDKFVVTLTNSTFREGITKGNILLTGLPDGLTYNAAVAPGTHDTLEITLGGASAKPMTRLFNLELVIKGNSVNELEATNSKAMILQIIGNPGNAGDSIITPWKDNKTAAYTATYDDGIIDSLKRFLPLHEKYGFKATIALVPTFIDDGKHPDDGYYSGNGGHVSMGSWDDFRDLVGTGYFEVASHMMNHAMSGTSGDYQGRDVPTFLEEEGAEALEQDFRDSKARLEAELGLPCNTLIYPHYDTNEDINAIAEKVYEAARTSGDEFDGNSPDADNYYYLYSKTFLDAPNAGADHDTTVDEAKEWLDKAIEKGYWLITVGHGNNYEGWGAPPLSVYDGLYSYVAENKDIVWADTMGTISEYMKERNNSTITLKSSTVTSYRIGLTDTLDNSIYDQALTVRTNIPENWTNVKITQGGRTLASRIETEDAGKYVYYNALPDSGDILIKSGSGSSGNDGKSGTVQNPGTTTNGNVITAQPVVDPATGVSTTAIGISDIDNAFRNSDTAIIKIPASEAVSKYLVNLPAPVVSSDNTTRRIEIDTEIGTVSIPENMFSASEIGTTQTVGISIASAGQIDGKPVVELGVTFDGIPVSWSNPDAPVTVSIPYVPTEEEKADPEHITVLYIDGSGNTVSVPSGRYDPATGMVTFTVTHFSKYAVAFVEKTFSDIVGYDWARNAIEVMASKGVVNGTSGSSFSPSSNITRADFILLLTKALNLSARTDGNFSDVNPSAYYYGAVGVAKKLGITTGVGNNRFDPNAFITRQEMMTLADRALAAAKRELAAGTQADLGKFGDKDIVADYAVQSIAKLVKNGIVTGNGANINPLGNTTRAEAAVIIYRIYNAGLN